MTVKFISENTKDARLANRRVVLVRDETCQEANYDGEIFGLLIEEWNNEERQFKMVDSLWQVYGFDEVKANIIDIVCSYDIDCFVVDNDLGDPENWKDEFREFDVADFS
jgi:hypothetical protein